MESLFTTNPDIQKRIVATSDLSFAFPTNIPITHGHLIICPKRVVKTAQELTRDELLDIFSLIKKLQPSLKSVFGATGFNYAWNDGEVAGQSIPHLHIHMIPRRFGDTGITEYDPRKFLYRPGSRAVSPQEELDQVARDIKDALR